MFECLDIIIPQYYVFIMRNSSSPCTEQAPKGLDGTGLADKALRLDSIPRQLEDKISLCKSYAVISKENNNLQLAWHLSAQIRAAQQLITQVKFFSLSQGSQKSGVPEAIYYRLLQIE